jgi:hypothetical protein
MTGMVGEARDASSSEFASPARVRVFAVGVLVAAFLIGGCGGGSSTTSQTPTRPDRDAALKQHKDNPTRSVTALNQHKDNPTRTSQGGQAGQ